MGLFSWTSGSMQNSQLWACLQVVCAAFGRGSGYFCKLGGLFRGVLQEPYYLGSIFGPPGLLSWHVNLDWQTAQTLAEEPLAEAFVGCSSTEPLESRECGTFNLKPPISLPWLAISQEKGSKQSHSFFSKEEDSGIQTSRDWLK